MVPYLILMFLPVIFYYVSFSKKKGKFCLEIGDGSTVTDNNWLLPAFFVIFTLILALRDETIGRDIIKYKYYFEKISRTSFMDLFSSDWEILYVMLNWLVGHFTDNYQIFLAITALITVIPIAITYSQDSEHCLLKVMLFLNMPTFIMSFSGLRQTMAISMGVVAYEFVKKKKLIPFILFALIAFGFHHSAFIVFLLYPLYHNPFKKKHLWFVIPGFLFIFAFNRQIFTAVTRIVSEFFSEEDYLVTMDDNGAYTMVILFIMFAVLSFFIPNEDKMDEESLGLRSILIIAATLQCFAPIYMIAMRMNYYFIILVPIAISKILKCSKSNLKDVAWLAKVVMVVFFMGYYMLNMYRGCRTGISTLDTYPYVPFWK